jgi:hypothetical protein
LEGRQLLLLPPPLRQGSKNAFVWVSYFNDRGNFGGFMPGEQNTNGGLCRREMAAVEQRGEEQKSILVIY